MSQIEDLKAEKVKALQEARAKVEAAQKDSGTLSAEDQAFVDKAMADYDEWEAKAQTEEKSQKLNAILEAAEKKPEIVPEVKDVLQPETKQDKEAGLPITETKQYASDFAAYLRGANPSGLMSQAKMYTKADGVEGTAAAGGYLVPKLLADQLLVDIAAAAPMLDLVKQVDISGFQLDVDQSYSHGAAAWTLENGAFNTGDEAYAQVTITAYKATRITKVSEELLLDSKFNLDSHLGDMFGRSFGVLFNTALTVGTGGVQPWGLIPRVASGQLVTGGTVAGVNNIISGDVFDLFHKVAPQYRTEQAVFMGRDATVKLVRVLKDTTGQYLWQPGLQAGIPDRLLGHRFIVNPDVVAANTSTKSLYFGRPDGYWAINPAGGITIQRLNELYAATGQVGFRGFLRIGGDFVGPADSQAAYVQSAT